MKLENLYLCIHYDKHVDFSGHFSEIQPGDTEISYLAGNAKYSIIGFNVDKFDDYGELCFATNCKTDMKNFIIENNFVFEGKYDRYSELLDYHDNFEKDEVGQWKMISLKGTFEKKTENEN